MKPTLLFAALSLGFASPSAFGKTELEILRSRCSEQESQLQQLKQENSRLRGSNQATSSTAKTQTVSNAIAKPEAAKSAAPSSGYVVKAGDNLDKIARKIGTSPEKLAKANGLKTSSIIHPGQKLKVPGGSSASASQTVAAASSPAPQSSGGKTHKVQQGETFASISRKHGISTDALVAANPKVKPSALRPGQVVNLGGSAPSTTMIAASKTPVPVEKAPAPAPAVAQKAPAAHPNVPISTPPSVSKPAPATTTAAAEPKSSPAVPQTAAEKEKPTLSPAPEKKIHPVTIDGEMTYGEFASKHGTDTERLNALNGLDLTTATVLAKGSELYVPAQP